MKALWSIVLGVLFVPLVLADAGPRSDAIGKKIENFQLREADNGHILRAELPQIVLRKGEDVQVWAEWEEAKRADDISHLVLKYPTTNVHITLEGDENMQIIAYIAHGHEALIQQGPRHYIFRGALLPRQAIFVRWYPVGA